MLTFKDAVKVSCRRMFTYEGRSSRKEFWSFFAVLMIIFIPSYAVKQILNDAMLHEPNTTLKALTMFTGLIMMILLMVLGIAAARRLQDSGLNPGMAVLVIPPATPILLLLCLRKGTAGDNAYGKDPESENFYKDFLK